MASAASRLQPMAMADEGRLTNERLKGWNLDSASRERMCLLLLATEPQFSQLRPRRPEGGPDEGRDIEGIYNVGGGLVFYGAVGFRRNVSDDADDKRKIKEKFKNDLDSALRDKSDLKAFVFLTNVDLTDAEISILVSHARGRGLEIIEIYHRERLRFLLDGSPGGWAVRFRFLDIEMTKEEQLAFLNGVLNQVAQSVGTQATQIIDAIAETEARQSAQLRELNFSQARMRAIRRLDAAILLTDEIEPGELRKFAMVFCISRGRLEPDAAPELVMTSQEDYLIDTVVEPNEPMRLLYQSWQRAWALDPSRDYGERRYLDRATKTTVVRSTLILHAPEQSRQSMIFMEPIIVSTLPRTSGNVLQVSFLLRTATLFCIGQKGMHSLFRSIVIGYLVSLPIHSYRSRSLSTSRLRAVLRLCFLQKVDRHLRVTS